METEGTQCREGGLYCDGTGPFDLHWQGGAASSGQQPGRVNFSAACTFSEHSSTLSAKRGSVKQPGSHSSGSPPTFF